MIRKIAVVGLFSGIMLGCMPAYGQEMPELDGAPPPLKIPKPTVTQPQTPPKITPKPTPKIVTPAAKPKVSQPVADRTKAEEARLAGLAAAQKAEQARLEKQANDLEVRAAELAARERQFAEQSAAERAELKAQQAELARQSDEIARQLAEASKPRTQPLPQVAVREPDPVDQPSERRSSVRGFNLADVDLEMARRSCTRAGLREARERNFYSAWYDRAPRLSDEGRSLELRGYMRVEDRRGYLVVDTVCEVDADGEALNFAFLR
jgi:hypothetical protein